MITRDAQAVWSGPLKQGHGTIRFDSFAEPYSFASRFGDAEGTTPEALIAAAHAGCYAMALALVLGKHGHAPGAIRTTAEVSIEPGSLTVTKSALEVEAEVPGLDEAGFRQIAEEAKQACPVSRALAGVEVVLASARLAPTA